MRWKRDFLSITDGCQVRAFGAARTALLRAFQMIPARDSGQGAALADVGTLPAPAPWEVVYDEMLLAIHVSFTGLCVHRFGVPQRVGDCIYLRMDVWALCLGYQKPSKIHGMKILLTLLLCGGCAQTTITSRLMTLKTQGNIEGVNVQANGAWSITKIDNAAGTIAGGRAVGYGATAFGSAIMTSGILKAFKIR